MGIMVNKDMEQTRNKESWLFLKKVLDLMGDRCYIYIIGSEKPEPRIAR